MLCDTDEQLEDSVKRIKRMSNYYELMKNERFEFIDSHEEIAENVYCTTYSNGTRGRVDYNEEKFEIIRQ